MAPTVKQGRQKRPLIGLLIIMAGIFKEVFSEEAEVCNAEDLSISCSLDHIILVTLAEFGRMDLGRCIKKEDEFLGCKNDVLPLLDRWCSGRRECRVRVSNEDLEAANENCLDILKQYLKVEYICLTIGVQCRSSQPNHLSGSIGYISSLTTDTKGCGSIRSPWIISAKPGQTVKLDLIDFASSQHTSNLVSCHSVYGYVVEKTLGINHTICGGRQRNGELYVSKTNRVEVMLLSRETRHGANFLIHYSVTGCPELTRPSNSWYKREGNEAVIGCENNNKEWRLICSGTKWQGEIGNCTETVSVIQPEVAKPDVINVSSVVVISGIAGVAVVLSVIAIMIGIVYLNKYRIRQEVKRSNLFKTYMTMDRNVSCYYQPTTLDPSTNNDLTSVMALQRNSNELLTQYPGQCTCATLQMRNCRDGDQILDDVCPERQSLYNSIKST